MKIFDALMAAAYSAVINPRKAVVNFIMDGGAVALTTGSKGFIQIPYSATVKNWTVIGNTSDTIAIGVKKSSYAGFPTTVAMPNSDPALSSAQKNTGSANAWTTKAITAGDILEFTVESTGGVLTQVIISLELETAF